MKYNTASQKFHIIAFDVNGRVSGEAANITCQISIDDGSRVATSTTNPVEIGTTGEYTLDLTQAESNGHKLSFSPVCGTSGVQVKGDPDNVIYTSREDEVLTALSDMKGAGFDTADDSLANLAASVATSLTGVTVVKQVGPGFDTETNRFELMEGDDYLYAQKPARHTDFTIDAPDTVLTGWTVAVGYESSDGTKVAGNVSLIDAGGGQWTVRVEWTAAQIAIPGHYRWGVRLSQPTTGYKYVPITGDLVITNSPLEDD